MRALSTAAICVAILTVAASRPEAATTWLQGEILDQDGTPSAGAASLAIPSGSPQTTAGVRGLFVIDDLTPGARDELCVDSVVGIGCGEQRYFSLTPATGQSLIVVSGEDIVAWRGSVAMEGDGTRGEIFGIVRDSSGGPVGGATVTITPATGSLYTLDDDGTLSISATTFANGRFLALDVGAGEFTARASGAIDGLAYGLAKGLQTAAITLRPTATIGGTVVDESGTGVLGATVEWDRDPAVAGVSGGGGAWSLPGVASNLDTTVRASASGFQEALTLRASVSETPDPAAIEVRLLSSASYTVVPAAFGLVQSPSLGMIIGRIVDAVGAPLAGGVVSVDPEVGEVRYFNSAGAADPSLAASSSSGKFAVFNVPTGDVVISAVAPAATVRSFVAPSRAGAVTQGDLISYETQTVTGTVLDETDRTTHVAGTIVQVVEFPYLSTISDSNGLFRLDGVPKDTLISLRAARAGHTDTYTFRRNSGTQDSRAQDITLASENSILQLYARQGLSFDRTKATVGASIFLGSGEAVIGLHGSAIPPSGSVSYPGSGATKKHPLKATSTFGNINILSVVPGEGAVAAIDPRADFLTFELAPMRAQGVVVDSLPVACDTTPLTLSNLYPCDAASIVSGADPMDFHWRGEPDVNGDGTDELGRFQVQFSRDAAFSTIDVTSTTTDREFIVDEHWRPGKTKWKKILGLGESGAVVYWRVLQSAKISKDERLEIFSDPYSFTVR